MSSTQHTGTVPLVDADRQTEAIKKIMMEQGLDYGPACDVYIKEQQFKRAFPAGHLPKSGT